MLKVFLGAMTSFIMIIVGLPFLINCLQQKKIGQKVRELGPRTHLVKDGIPNMGGILFIPVFIITALLFVELSAQLIWTIIMVSGFALIGFSDDYIKVKGNRSLGLKARQKVFLMFLLTSLLGLYVYIFQPSLSSLSIPFMSTSLHLGKAIIPLIIVVYMATGNSVNLADGMDGVVSGLTAISLGAILILSLQAGNLNSAIISGIGIGICLGFLWYNCHPARIIMGDTGSLMLGSLLASLSVFLQLELFLIIIGGVFVLVALSVILQVLYFKFTGGKRLFKMAPLHHHFELSGWSEPQTVIRFWILSIIFAAIGVLGGL